MNDLAMILGEVHFCCKGLRLKRIFSAVDGDWELIGSQGRQATGALLFQRDGSL